MLRRCESQTWKFGFIKPIRSGEDPTLETWAFHIFDGGNSTFINSLLYKLRVDFISFSDGFLDKSRQNNISAHTTWDSAAIFVVISPDFAWLDADILNNDK